MPEKITSADELESYIENYVEETVGETSEDVGISYEVTLRVLDEDGEEKDRVVVSNDE